MPALSTAARHGLLFQLKTKVLGCFGDTTAHGYGRVAASETQQLRKWFWLIVCTAAFVIFTQQLYVITQQYMSRPLKTRTSIGHDEVQFSTDMVQYQFDVLTKNCLCHILDCRSKVVKAVFAELWTADQSQLFVQ